MLLPTGQAIAKVVKSKPALISVRSSLALPEGDSGIAAKYPGDAARLAADSAVLFFDDFESYVNAAGLTTKWDDYYQKANTRIATEVGNVFAGG